MKVARAEHHPAAPDVGSTPALAGAADPPAHGFEPLLQHISEQQRQADAARSIAEANSRAQAHERVNASDLRQVDEHLRSRHEAEAEAERAQRGRPQAAALGAAAAVDPRGAERRGNPEAARRRSGLVPPRQAPGLQAQAPAASDARAAAAEVNSGSPEGAPAPAAPPTRPGATQPAAQPFRGQAAGSALRGPLAGPAGVSASAATGGRAGGESASGSSTADSGHLAKRAESLPRNTPQGPTPRSVDPAAAQRTIHDVLRVLRAEHGNGRARVKLQLSPPELGRLTVELNMQRQHMSIRIVADSAQVRNLLQTNAAFLTEALQDIGLSVERFDIELQDPVPAAADPGGHGPAQQTFDHAGGSGEHAEAHGEVMAEDQESRLEAELPADVFIPGHVDITA